MKTYRRSAVLAAAALCLAFAARHASAGIYPQAGAEFYAGANKMTLFTPWAGVRFSLSGTTSLIVKYYNHNLSYTYQRFDEATQTFTPVRRTANLSNFTTVIYHQKNGFTSWGAVSLLTGTDGYKAVALDAGVGWQLTRRLAIETGTYILREKSVLWFPDAPARTITVYSLKATARYLIVKGVYFNPAVYVYRNSERVNAWTYAAGFLFIPKEPFYLTVSYFKYAESAQYKFSGDYVSAGLNLYF